MARVLVGMALVVALAAGCRDDDPGTTVTAPTSTTTAPTTTVPTTTTTGAGPTSTTSPLPAPPWAGPKLRGDQVPAVLVQEWRAGGAREDCAALAPADLGPAASGTPRRANFGDRAWAVAWDVPGAPGRQASGEPCSSCGRGTVVVAGTSLDVGPPGAPPPANLPNVRRWADGSSARYGPEGGTGPAYLAQLEVAGERCLYNVVSFLGQAHLERLLDSLRFVEGAP